MGWSLQLRGRTWYVFHRFTPTGKQVAVTTGQIDRELALQSAIDIVKEARKTVAITNVRGEDIYTMIGMVDDALINIDEKAVEGDAALLGNYLDKTDPRLTT